MVSKSINSDTTSTGHRLIHSFCSADSCISTSIIAIFLICHKFQIFNAVVFFILVLMIDLQAFGNRSLMSHKHKSMHKHIFLLTFIIVDSNHQITTFDTVLICRLNQFITLKAVNLPVSRNKVI